MNKNLIAVFFKGVWVGGTMTVPGISGGSMAMLLGIYDKLISAVNTFWKKKDSLLFLSLFASGGGLGMILFSKAMLYLLNQYPAPLKYFFLGAVAGGIPVIYREAQIKKLSIDVFLYPLVGILSVILLSQLPDGMFSPQNIKGPAGILIQILAGILTAAALVLPGISVSQTLLMMGIYEGIIENIGTLQFIPLIPLGIGLILGIFLTADLMERLMKAHPMGTYLVILGFLLGSLSELYPGIPHGGELAVSIAMAAAGFLALYGMQKGKSRSRDI